MLRRKSLLAAATLAAVVAIAATSGVAVSAAGKKQSRTPVASQHLTGTWMSTVTLKAPPPGVDPTFLALNTFAARGVVLVSSSQSLPAQRSLAQGECKRIGDLRFACSFTWFRFDAAGKFAGTQRVRRTMTLSPSLDTYTSTDVVEIIAPNGAVVATLDATEEAKRLD